MKLADQDQYDDPISGADPGKGAYVYKGGGGGGGVHFVDLSHFLKISHENEIIWSH